MALPQCRTIHVNINDGSPEWNLEDSFVKTIAGEDRNNVDNLYALLHNGDESLAEMVTGRLPVHTRPNQSKFMLTKGLKALRKIRNKKVKEIKRSFKSKHPLKTEVRPQNLKVEVIIPGGASMHIDMLWPASIFSWPAVKLRTSQIEHSVRYIRYYGCGTCLLQDTCERPTSSV